MTCNAVFVGGPLDGQTMTMPTENRVPPDVYTVDVPIDNEGDISIPYIAEMVRVAYTRREWDDQDGSILWFYALSTVSDYAAVKTLLSNYTGAAAPKDGPS
jgi:hypothetical protein